ncbi:DUF6383 domain-containing protein [Parabacteroides chongii]|uniref:DUF6383 domain-containing protein n=1 Tax=Parabacteroides chongii TaxID=2685834 RepID=UPI00240D1900|nr:DUF6383 domain-containing protein [Parabacteroides chongii]WFE86847.1 DUF6383 domain-containing protein [Parabacteroides chongii]
MNKKFSTLVASLLLAGAWTTADAELVKVTPQAGGTYLVGTTVNEADGKITNLLQTANLHSTDATVSAMSDAWILTPTKTADNKDCFYLTATTNYVGLHLSFVLSNSSDGYTGYSNEAGAAPIKFIYKGDKLVVAENTSATGGAGFEKDEELVLTAGGRVTVTNTGNPTLEGTKLAFAIYNDDVTVLSSLSELNNPLALQTSFNADEYYVIAADKDNLLYDDGNGALTTPANSTVTEANLDNYLWKISTGKAADGVTTTYTFENRKSGKKAVISNIDKFIVNGSAASFTLALNADDKLTADLATGAAAEFGIYKSPIVQAKADKLNALLVNGFNMTIKRAKGDNTLVKGVGAFGGKLKAEGATTAATRFQLIDDDKYVVLNKKADWNNGNIGANDRGYKFELVTKEALEADAAKDKNYLSWFEFNQYAGNTKKELYTVDVFADNAVTTTSEFGSLFVTSLNGQVCLTTTNGLVDATKEGWPYIVLAADNIVKPEDILADAYFTITKLGKEGEEDQIFAVTGCGDAHGWVESVGNQLEAQWAVTYNEETEEYTLTNRENTAATVTYGKDGLRQNADAEENVYTDGTNDYLIKTVPVDASDIYYKYLGDVVEKTFVMAHHSGVYDLDAWFTMDEDGYVLIDKDKDNALEIKATNGKVAKKDTAEVKTAVNFYKDGKLEKKEYTLKVPVYKFAVGDNKLGLSNDKYQFDADADVFAIRKDGDYWNLRTVEVAGDGVVTMECGKVWASTSDAAAGYLKYTGNLYSETTNDLFVVEENNRPVYRRLGATIENDGFTGKVDTAKFYRTNDVTSYYLYENTMNRNTQGGKRSLNFLGESHLNDLPETAALPFLVDTAYVRNETTKPLYMLAVRDAEWVEGTPFKPCDKEDNHGYDENGNALTAEQCPHATPAVPGYRKADYLVVLSDSVDVKSKVDVKYKGYTRLAFVPATHFENDTLVIESSEFTNKKKEAYKDSLSIVDKDGYAQMNAATFAFRLVNPADAEEGGEGDFYIETIAENKEGKLTTHYVHVLNSVPVLVEDIKQAAPFNIESAEKEAATANDEINAEAISVIAGNGSVTVKGAEGKNVVITNVLGQTIANTVITSDEATISAPAGIVVVAVEGEAAVKAIVK